MLADYVTTEDGTGLVHQSPAFGAEDLAVCRAYGLPVVNPIGRDGHFLPEVGLVGGVFFKDADEPLVADLQQRGLLFKHVAYEHAYPHCWRCHTPLMYYALPSWYIRTTARKQELLAQNEATNWYPDTIKHGRYGDWLNNNIDWALSRDRYWGTPLPIWRNDADPDRLVCVGSLAELSELTGQDQSGLDPHRPYVDAPTFTLPGVAGTFRRVPQVIDAWFDSGSMPFAQFGAPHRNAELARASYPADFICEAIDQTRGWFYTLMVIGTLVFDQSSYRNVICLGHIMAEDGRKMSKHLGNILEPMPLMERHGADAVRWFMAASGSPWSQRRIGHKVLEEIASKVLRTYWSLASFQSLYARANGWSPAVGAARAAEVPGELGVLDRWARAETARVAAEVDAALEDYDAARAGRALAELIDDLSNWYVRRSRRRFWEGDPAALQTLHDCLHTLTRLLAPFVPFITESGLAGAVRRVHRRRVGTPGFLAGGQDVLAAGGRRGAGRAGGAGPPAGRTRPGGAGGLEGEDPAAAGPRADLGTGLGTAAGRAAGRGGRRAERGRAGRAGELGGPGGRHRQAQLPGARQAVRPAHQAGRGRDRGGRIRPRWPARCAQQGSLRASASSVRSAPRSWWSARCRCPAGRWRAAARTRWRWIWS